MQAAETINGTTLGVLLVTAVLAWPVTWLLLVAYRRQVVRAMGRASTDQPRRASAPAPERHRTTQTSQRAEEVTIEPVRASRSAADMALARGDRLRLVIWRRYALAGAVQAAILTIATLQSGQIAFTLVRMLIVWLAYAWPVVLTIALVSGFDRRVIARALGGYLAVLLAAGVVAGNPLGALAIWALLSGGPTVVTLFYLHPSVRAVAALVVVIIFAGLLGSLGLTSFVGAADDRIRTVADVAVRIGVGGVGAFAIMIVVGFTLTAILGMVLLRGLGAAYRNHGLPGDLVQIGSLWALFALFQGVPLAFEDPGWSLAAPVAFGAFLLIAAQRVRAGDETMPAPRLLLLRVFALGRRSEDLFRAVTTRWQHIGPIRVITGPDLARATVEPDEFLTFAAGRLDQLVVTDASQVEEREAGGGGYRDRHGRYRVREYLCAGDIWQKVVARLVAHTDLVLVDVRGFDRANAGTYYELVLLARTRMLGRTALIIDATTDRALVADAVAAGGGDLSDATVIGLTGDQAPSARTLLAAIPVDQ